MNNIFNNNDIRRTIFRHKTLNRKASIQNYVKENKKTLLLHLELLSLIERNQLYTSAGDLLDEGFFINEEHYDEYLNINYFHLYILQNIKLMKDFDYVNKNYKSIS